jgi:hypothetical protein
MNHWFELVRLCLEIDLTAQKYLTILLGDSSYSPTDIYKLFLEIYLVVLQMSVLGCVRMSANLFVPASPIIKSEESLGKCESGLCSCNFLFRESNIYIVHFKLTLLISTSVRGQFVGIIYLHRTLFECVKRT